MNYLRPAECYQNVSVLCLFPPAPSQKLAHLAEIFFARGQYSREDILQFSEFVETHPDNLGRDAFPLFHSFSGGVYTREIHLPKGHVVIGAIHKFENMVYVLKGKLLVADEFGINMIEAPAQFSSRPGVKRVAYILEDTVWVDIHHTDKTTVEEAEKELFTDSYDDLENDYLNMINAMGFSESEVRQISENIADLIDAPIYGVSVRDSQIQGKGVFADRDFSAGEQIGAARKGDKRTLLGRYANHSFTPNAKPENADGEMIFIATTDIAEGEEITVDYRAVRNQAIELDGGQL